MSEVSPLARKEAPIDPALSLTPDKKISMLNTQLVKYKGKLNDPASKESARELLAQRKLCESQLNGSKGRRRSSSSRKRAGSKSKGQKNTDDMLGDLLKGAEEVRANARPKSLPKVTDEELEAELNKLEAPKDE